MVDRRELSRQSKARQEQAYLDAIARPSKQVIRIGDRIQETGLYQVIHQDGVSSNGQKIFSADHTPGQVVRATQAPGQPTVTLDWKISRKAKRVEFEPAPAQPEPRILAFADYYGFSDALYDSYPDNKTFALNMFDWLASSGQRIATFSTESLQDVGGDVSIDAPEYSSLQADLDSRGFTITAIDLVSGDLEAVLQECNIFFVPTIVNSANQIDTAQANLLADFARAGNGLVMVSGWITNENYTGLYDVFGIQPISTSAEDVEPVSPIPEGLETLLSGVTSYRINSGDGQGGLIYAEPTSPNTFTKLFAQGSLLSPFNSGFAIELAEPEA